MDADYIKNPLVRIIHRVEDRHAKMVGGRPRGSLNDATPEELKKIREVANHKEQMSLF